MSFGFPKQSGSRPNVYQVLNCASATIFSTTFKAGTQQIRVCSQINGWGSIDQTTASIGVSSAGGTGMIITGGTTSANSSVYTLAGPAEYFTVTPGQFFSFASTSTSTGAISVTEMA